VRVPARRAVLLAALAAIAIPATTAQAKTKSVDMGLPVKAQDEFQNKYSSDVNAFFPSKITIRAGGKVRFNPVGFHTVDLPPDGGTALPLLSPAGQITGLNDAAGVPFWFNGQPKLTFNPQVLQGSLGKTVTRQGNSRVESGPPLAAKPKPMVVKFPKKGTYKYYCDIHPGMIGRVVVKGRHARIPSTKKDKKTVKKQLAAARKRAKKLASTAPAGNTVYTGGSAKGGVEYFGMLPAVKTVAPGTTVTFAMSPRSYDIHTATFGPGNPLTEPTSYLGVIAKSFEGTDIDQRGLYPSEKPPAVATYTTTLHGNGFWSSGVMDRSNATPLAASNTVTFSTQGTYDFYCMIHPFMHGQIKVQ
jgi:plastocyanin